MKKRTIAMLVPAHNEEKVIAQTLISLLKVTQASNIYVVNDGSIDNTQKIAKKYTRHVLFLKKNVGKANALNQAITHFKLTKKYEYLMPMDADTVVTKDFVKQIVAVLDKDKKRKYVCGVGSVVGKEHNWMTAYRVWEYEIAQSIHKKAQEIENAITVCPGCATIFRAKLFDKVQIPVGTVAEDMDLTFLIHRQGIGKIVFVNGAKVVTQDPRTVKDYVKQINRWYTGFWQCVFKHNIPWGGQMLDFEVALLASEGVFGGLTIFMFVALWPFVLLRQPEILVIPVFADLGLFMLPTLAFTGKKNKIWKIFRYLPQFYLLRFISSFIFIRSYFRVLLSHDRVMGWNKAVRYAVN